MEYVANVSIQEKPSDTGMGKLREVKLCGLCVRLLLLRELKLRI